MGRGATGRERWGKGATEMRGRGGQAHTMPGWNEVTVFF